MIELKSFAKINLGLEIYGKREDGYHNLKTIFQTINIFDTIKIRYKNYKGINLNGTDPSIGWKEENSIFKAFKIVKRDYDLKCGFEIFVEKKIPPGSGLGGGSSNAAVFLLFLNEHLKLGLSLKDLIKIGKEIGADVPFFLVGGTILAEGIGEKLFLLDDIEERFIGVVIPDIKVSTSSIFSEFSLTSTQFESKINIFCKSENFAVLENNLEKVTFRLFPEIKRIKDKMLRLGCEFVLMSGSGSSVYCLLNDQNISNLKREFPNMIITKNISRDYYLKNIGVWPSGKAPVFGAGIRRFESSRPRGLK